MEHSYAVAALWILLALIAGLLSIRRFYRVKERVPFVF